MAGQLIFQPPTFHWPSEAQQTGLWGVAESCNPHIGSIQYPQREMVCQHHWFPGHWRFQEMATSQYLQRHRKKENTGGRLHHLRKHLRSFNVPVELHWWNVQWHKRQGEQETTDQLDQCIKILVEKCGYPSTEEKERCWLELLFHATKHFEVKKWVRSQTALKETVTFNKLLQHAKQHEATIKDFHWHKSNGGVATSTTINEIRTFTRKGQGSWARARTRSKG